MAIFVVDRLVDHCVSTAPPHRLSPSEKKDSPLSIIRHFLFSFQIVEAGDFVEESMVENMAEEDAVENAHGTIVSAMEMGETHKNANESVMEDAKTPTVEEEEHNAAMNVIEMGGTAAHDNANNESMVVKNLETASTYENDEEVMNAVECHVETGAPAYIKLRTASGKRTVPNCCAVCLCTYKEGETIVWSSNGNCQHAFHNECVMEWLIKMQNGTPCPCCRQEFTDLTPNQ